MAVHPTERDSASSCSMVKAVGLVGERWTFLLLREALTGTTRFAEFRSILGIASDVLTARLTTLVDSGIMVRRSYHEPGRRARDGYHLTESGRDLAPVIGALQQWGDEHLTCPQGPTVDYRTRDGHPLTVRFVDDQGRAVDEARVVLERTSSHPHRPPEG